MSQVLVKKKREDEKDDDVLELLELMKQTIETMKLAIYIIDSHFQRVVSGVDE